MGNEALKFDEAAQPEVTTPGTVTRALEEGVSARRRKVRRGKIVVNRPSGLTPEWTAKVQEFQTKMVRFATPAEKKAEMDRVRREEPDLFRAVQISLSLGTQSVSEQLAANAEGLADANEVGEIIADAKLKAVAKVSGQVGEILKKAG